ALEAVLARGGVVAEFRVLRHMVDDHQPVAPADLVADGGGHHQLAAGLEAELNLVADRAGDPALRRHPCDGGESHAGGAADDFQDLRQGVDTADTGHVGFQDFRQTPPPPAIASVLYRAPSGRRTTLCRRDPPARSSWSQPAFAKSP